MAAFAIEPYHPINTPKAVAEDVWVVDGAPMGAGPGGLLPLTIRMTVVRLPDGSLWLHSPVPYDPSLAAALQALGAVGHLVAPSRAHASFIAEWQRAFPDAVLHAAEGVAADAAKDGRPLRVDAEIGATPDPRWGGAFAVALARGSYLTEAAFFHRAARTLVLTDLIANLEPARLSWGLRLVARAAGVLDPHGAMPRHLRATFLGKQRADLRAAVRTMLGWAPERVLFAHGRWYDQNGTAELRRAFAWLKV